MRSTTETDDYPMLLRSLALEWEADIKFNKMTDGSEPSPSVKIRAREQCDRQTLERRIQLLRDVAEHIEKTRVLSDDSMPCIACGHEIKDGDLVYNEMEGDLIHAACCGPERESYVGPDGEPLKNGEPIPDPWVWRQH